MFYRIIVFVETKTITSVRSETKLIKCSGPRKDRDLDEDFICSNVARPVLSKSTYSNLVECF